MTPIIHTIKENPFFAKIPHKEMNSPTKLGVKGNAILHKLKRKNIMLNNGIAVAAPPKYF
jgi:hypothetical protein